MAPIEWKAEYSVGDPAVDHSHRELIDLVNAAVADILEGRPDADVDRCLGDLYRAISAHFAHEELQMRLADYGDYPVHKSDHERLLDTLRDIMDDAAPHDEEAARRMTAALEAWFVDHFRTHDARLHDRLGPHPH